ncbi:MAG TPA: glycosyltransferase family protein, partial [Candidatus Binatia bacterium]|nr:glycosyltransferase family protein [Candidatus Binatia bacterium]
MKIMFTVQGEGRGHMTQAIAMSEMLQRRGHQIVAVVAGTNQTRSLPTFFEQAFAVPVRPILSPGFSLKQHRGISMPATLGNIIRNLPAYRKSLKTISQAIKDTQPDLIVNFLEPLMGVYNLLRAPKTPVLVVGHQYMLEHPDFVREKKFKMEQLGMKFYIAVTGAKSSRMALSFYHAPDLPKRKLFVSPPILRRQLFALQPDFSGGHLLVYLLNHGYATEISNWHQQNPAVPIHCFYDKPGAAEEERMDETLTFHRIHGEKFLRLMGTARGVACTAGFESVSEGAYLGKPLLLIPVENHLEQYLNACDAERTGLGMRDSGFHLSRLLQGPKGGATAKFRDWVDQAEAIAMRTVESVAGIKAPS